MEVGWTCRTPVPTPPPVRPPVALAVQVMVTSVFLLAGAGVGTAMFWGLMLLKLVSVNVTEGSAIIPGVLLAQVMVTSAVGCPLRRTLSRLGHALGHGHLVRQVDSGVHPGDS